MTMLGTIVSILFVLLSPTNTGVAANICDTATLLYSLPKRLNGYVLGPNDSPLCDSFLQPGWYSMGPNVLATTHEGCGTDYPWYMTGTLPEAGTTNVTVCKYISLNERCQSRTTIQVHRCSENTYIFDLKPTYGCSEAYCIERLIPTNITKEPPTISVIPSIRAAVVRPPDPGIKNELTFYCDLDRNPDEAYYYTVKWYQSDGTSLISFIWASDPVKFDGNFTAKTALVERIFARSGYKLGIRIVCTIAASHEIASITGPTQVSKDKFIGIEVVNKTATVEDKKQAIVYLKLTVPFGCENENTSCPLLAIALIPTKDSKCQTADVAQRRENFEQRPCGVTFLNTEVGVLKPLRLDALIGDTTTRTSWRLTARMATLPVYEAHPLFANYVLDPMTIFLRVSGARVSGKECHACNDPWMRSFDGLRYDNHNLGDFILYKHRLLDVQIQIKTSLCPGQPHAYCVCGVAVAVGRDVFVMDNCIRAPPRFRSCRDGIMNELVYHNARNDEYMINLPTGSRCKIRRARSHFYNVYVYPSTYDREQSEGLCGVLDDDQHNDRFIRPGSSQTDTNLSWRVGSSESLFVERNDQTLPQWRETENLCYCDLPWEPPVKPIVHCHVSKVKQCQTDDIQPTRLPCTIQRQKRRSPRDTYQHYRNHDTYVNVTTSFYGRYTMPPLKSSNLKIQKRDVYDAATARQDCLSALNTTVSRLCSTVPGIDLEPYITDCTNDAIFTNSMDWALTHLEGIKSNCKYQLYINQPLPPEITSDPDFINNATEADSNTTTVNDTVTSSEIFTPEFLDKVEKLACTNECFGNGICNSGQCECDPGFGDVDCSVRLSDPPVMLGIPDSGLCDLTLRNCEKTSVFGDDFVQSKQLLCRLLPFHMTDPSTVKYATASTTRPALRLSFAEVSCPLDKHVTRRKRSELENEPEDYIARGYSIAITNDGINYGLPDSVVIFDSTCVNCTKDDDKIFCKKDASNCLKNGLCYEIGETHGCQTCRSTSSSDAYWDNGPDCKEMQTPENPTSQLWIMAPVLGSLAGLSVVFVVALCIWKWKSKKTGPQQTVQAQIFNVYDQVKRDGQDKGKENVYDTLDY